MGGSPGTKTTQRNQRANDSFKQRYGMTRSEWSEFKKTNPEEAKVKREKALARIQFKVVKQP